MKVLRVLLVDDHALVRAGIRSLLKDLSGVEVVAEASNGREALKLVAELKPDLALIDIVMPELNGLDATARIRASFPGTQVIILSMNASEEYVLQALRAGAGGYLLKDASPRELEQAIQTVGRGETFLSSAVSRHLVAGLLQQGAGDRPSLVKLTPRQREVLQLISEGNTTKEIAKKLDVSVKTVETHRLQLMDALNIHDIAGLVRYAIRVGLVEAH